MSYVNLMANDVWSESDITNRGRAIIESHVSEARQNELRTIMLGHIAKMRQASQEELAEIMTVQALTEQVVLDNAAARSDALLLAQVIELEKAITRLALPLWELPVLDTEGFVSTEQSPEYASDESERRLAGLIVSAAEMLPGVMSLYALRNPVPEPVKELAEVTP